jgi:uncharacterized protein
MKCPTCVDSTLVLSARDGVEIDYCPSCRGVWLDRGELDKIIERSANEPTRHASPPQQSSRPDFIDSDFRSNRYPQGQRKKSWLNEIFD